MAVKEILLWPDPILKKISEPVTDFGTSLQSLVKDLSDTMASEPMAGLSAPQIGVSKRIFMVDIDPRDNEGNGTKGREVFINPEIEVVKSEGTFTWEEGCMSIIGFRGKVTRACKVILRYQNLKGEHKEREAISYLSGCFQHELDHLNGIMWVDHQSTLKMNMIKRKMLKIKKLPPHERPTWQD